MDSLLELIQVKTLYSSFYESANIHGNHIAMKSFLREKLQQITYADLLQQILETANILRLHCPRPRLPIAILAPTNSSWVINFFAIQSIDCVVVALDPSLDNQELIRQLHLSDSVLLLTTTQLATHLRLSEYNGIKTLLIDENYKEIISSKEMSEDFLKQLVIHCNTAVILFTSGTTGEYRGVELTHLNILYSALICANNINLSVKDNILCILPANHIFGLTCVILAPLLSGASITFVAQLEFKNILKTMQLSKPTILVSVPRLYDMLFNQITADINKRSLLGKYIYIFLLSISSFSRRHLNINIGKFFFRKLHILFGGNVNFFISGAAALEAKILKTLEAMGITVIEGYGLTETSGCAIANTPYSRVPGSVGHVMPGITIKIIQPDERGIGEICLKGPTIMRGYYKNKDATENTIINGWLHTGDLGFANAAGNITVSGRIKDVIVLANGKKALANVIESYFKQIDGIDEFIIVGLSHGDKITEEIHAVVKLDNKGGAQQITQQQFVQNKIIEVAKNLPHWWSISRIHFLTELPKTTTLKIKRRELRNIILNKISAENNEKQGTFRIVDGFKHINSISNTVLDCIYYFLNNKNISNLDISENTSLHYDLGVDSIGMYELHSALENKFNINLPMEKLANANSIGDLVLLINQICDQQNITKTDVNLSQAYKNDSIPMQFTYVGATKRILNFLIKKLYLAYFNIKIEGQDNLPNVPFILCSNHVSHLDAISLMIATGRDFNDIILIAAKDYFFKTSLRSKIFTTIFNAIPFDRSAGLIAMQQNLENLTRCNLEKKIIIFFPEGTRSIDGQLQGFRMGVALFAHKLNLQVLPAHISGTYQALPKGKIIPKSHIINVSFGKPLSINSEKQDATNINYHLYKDYTDQLRTQVLLLQK